MNTKMMFSIKFVQSLVVATILCLSLALVFPSQAREIRTRDVPDVDLFPSDSRISDMEVTFMNRSLMSPSTLGTFPGNFTPPQCPYDTWSRPVKLPLLGNVDVKLFCVPKEPIENPQDEKTEQKR